MRYVIKRDGFEGNDIYYIRVNETDTNLEIIQSLKNAGILKSGCLFLSFKITGEFESDLNISYRGRLILTLRKVLSWKDYDEYTGKQHA